MANVDQGIFRRPDLRQTHIVVGDTLAKIDDRALCMNDPDIIRSEPCLRNARIMIVNNDWHDTDDKSISRQVDLIISRDGRILLSNLWHVKTPEYEDIKLEDGVVRFLVPEDKQLLQRLARKIVI